jgi:hypothetical protein
MGAPLVRRDELDAELGKLRKARAAGMAEARDPDKAFITRADLRAALAPILAALEIPEPPAEEPAEVEPAPVTGFESIDKETAE